MYVYYLSKALLSKELHYEEQDLSDCDCLHYSSTTSSDVLGAVIKIIQLVAQQIINLTAHLFLILVP